MARSPAQVAEEMDSMLFGPDDFDDPPPCSRCGELLVTNVLYDGRMSSELLCKQCIRVLRTFETLKFKVELTPDIVLDSASELVRMWLEHDSFEAATQ